MSGPRLKTQYKVRVRGKLGKSFYDSYHPAAQKLMKRIPKWLKDPNHWVDYREQNLGGNEVEATLEFWEDGRVT